MDSVHSHEKCFQLLLEHGRMPKVGWPESTVEFVLRKLALMDSNNFPSNVGVGEREGRIYSAIVARRHFHFAHGIGRSGDIVEVQPKAAGSSLLYKVTNLIANHALKIAGLSPEGSECIVFPMATGLTLAMTMITLKARSPSKKYVAWVRIDQKSCFKSIFAAGLEPIVVENVVTDNGMVTDIEGLRALLESRAEEILCVLSTTSCFAPRQPDLVDEIAKLCKQYGVGHVINNAYGLQCSYISKLITRACRIGRVDAVVQSTDKNFLVPVGGAIVESTDGGFLKSLSSMYPGRASMAPILDLFITLVSMGENGYRKLLTNRKEVVIPKFWEAIQVLVEKYGLEVIHSPHNSISFAIKIDNLPTASKGYSFLGSMLFQRNISGCRVVMGRDHGANSTINGHRFVTWGAHQAHYPGTYFTVACAIGLEADEIDSFLGRLDKAIAKFVRVNSSREEEEEGEEGTSSAPDAQPALE